MEIESLEYIGIGMPLIFIVMFLYIHMLLGIAKKFSGVVKFVLSTLFYFIFAAIMVAPLLLLIVVNRSAIQESMYSLVIVLLGYCCILPVYQFEVYQVGIPTQVLAITVNLVLYNNNSRKLIYIIYKNIYCI